MNKKIIATALTVALTMGNMVAINATNVVGAEVECFESLAEATNGKSYTAESSADITEIIETIIEELPETVVEPSIFEKIWAVLIKMFYIITFQWDKL